MTKDGLYHAAIGNIPWGLFGYFCDCDWGLEYGQHARRAALDDRYGQLTSVPLHHKFTRAEVFEVEVEQGRIVKFAARLSTGFSIECDSKTVQSWGNAFDLILVCVPSLREPGNLFVKTLWLNERADGHRTLDCSKYVRP